MKFIYILSFLLAFGINLSIAQTTKGTQFLGLTVGFGIGDSKTTGISPLEQTQLSFSFAPQYSYFIADKWELGGSVGYSYSKSKYTYLEDENSNSEYKLNSYGSSLFLRRHILITEKIALRAGPYASYSYGKEKNEPKETNPEYDPDSKMFSTGVNLGIEFFPVERLGISANLANISYQYQKTGGLPYENLTHNSFNAGLTNQLSLSVFLVF